MYHATIAAAVRRFPLLGRPRPDCPPLPLRIQEITDAANTAAQKGEHGMADAAHALNKAALIASDAGMPELARQLCWQHIDTYRRLTRPLTTLEAHYMLEPVLNLARLQIRADQGTPALRLIEAMYQAVTHRTDLTIGKHTLPIANLTGDRDERRKLREWAWLQLVGEGIRILALGHRWRDAPPTTPVSTTAWAITCWKGGKPSSSPRAFRATPTEAAPYWQPARSLNHGSIRSPPAST
ncbi:hypothetical protein [Salinispora arenicola]|uniref:hypothetical protein n=1 Tax=Salinispora arenicola TaxID=168697 RepID=UPI0003A8D644|nr:hypothetical protein [Salinispora arenicola]